MFRRSVLSLWCKRMFFYEQATRVERCTPMEYTHYPNAFSSVSHASMALAFIYCGYIFIATKVITLHIVRNYFSLYFIKYS